MNTISAQREQKGRVAEIAFTYAEIDGIAVGGQSLAIAGVAHKASLQALSPAFWE